MAILHPPLMDPDRNYVIVVSHTDDDDTRPRWMYASAKAYLLDQKITASADWTLMRDRLGWGIMFGRNGSESDMGLDLHAGRFASVFLRFRSPWTKWLNVTDRTRRDWYEPRHTGIEIHRHKGHLVTIKVDCTDSWHKGQPWWRQVTLNTLNLLGRTRTNEQVIGEGRVSVVLPEGAYSATYKTTRTTWTHPHRLIGRLHDRFRPRPHSVQTRVSVDGGVPVNGKGENSWDCGMDGIFSTGARTADPDQAALAFADTVLSGRARYGGPNNLPTPMTVAEAENL